MVNTHLHVELRSVSKRFHGVEALADINLGIEKGTIHALVGENGAGKSTLGKIIAGILAPTEGELLVDGRPVQYTSPRDALADGITMISQELTLVPQRTVLDNVYLGIESHRLGIVDSRRLRRRFEELDAQTGFGLAPETAVAALRVAEQKKVELLRALARNARLLVMDEPTAALSADESRKLLEIVRALKAVGTTVIYVSHFLEEVLELADSVTVLRNGRLIRTSPAADETPESLVTAMLGRSMAMTFPPKEPPRPGAPVVLAVDGLASAGVISDISFSIRAGEIVGLAGLVGSGRSEVARAIFGADRRQSGSIMIDGRPVNVRAPRDAVRAGITLLPESRKLQGLVLGLPVGHNVTLPHLNHVNRVGVMRLALEEQATSKLLRELDVRPPDPRLPVLSLSGGNQQKVLFAKWLFHRPRVLIADEPTHGVDVGAKRAIYRLIKELAAEGMAVLMISSEVEEVLGLAHRVLVMRKGGIVAEFQGASMTEDAVMHAAFATDRKNGSNQS